MKNKGLNIFYCQGFLVDLQYTNKDNMNQNPLIPVFKKASKWNGYQAQASEYSVAMVPNRSIAIYKHGELVNQFNLGSEAEYGSYNLRYTGPISRISPKQVQVTAYPGTMGERKHNLSLYEFCWRNERFNAAECAAYNANEMMFI